MVSKSDLVYKIIAYKSDYYQQVRIGKLVDLHLLLSWLVAGKSTTEEYRARDKCLYQAGIVPRLTA